MSDDILSQEELDALLKDAMGEDSDGEKNKKEEVVIEELNDMEKDTLGEIGNISMGTAATTLSTLLGKKVDITTPLVEVTSARDLATKYTAPLVAINVKYKKGLEGSNIMILRVEDVKVITDLMMGKEEVDLEREITDLDLSAVSEAMNQMMGSSSTSMSEMLGMRIDIYPPEAQKITFEEGKETINILKDGSNLIKISFRMVIEGYLDSNILQIVPLEFGREMVKRIMGIYSGQEEKEQDVKPVEEEGEDLEKLENTAAAVEETEEYKDIQTKMDEIDEKIRREASEGLATESQREENLGDGVRTEIQSKPKVESREAVSVTRPRIPSFEQEIVTSKLSEIDLVGDIPVEITVELGRTHKKIGDILEFGRGTVVELNKLVGEALNIYANGKYIASGEVVVIDDNFGIRITEIDSSKQKMI